MSRERFRLALRELKPSDWEHFEQLASAFLVSDFSDLRTLASPSGDDGRDATLFAPVKNAHVAIQYSVSGDWKTKINKTLKRLRDTSQNASILVYVTNQRIGADADTLKQQVHTDSSVFLDIRDQNWFLDRYNTDSNRRAAADDLAIAIADPFLAGSGVVETKGQALTNTEARTGLVYLTLQWENDTREKGLTRLSFDALVRAALRGTDKDHRLPRGTILDTIAHVLPEHPRDLVDAQVNSALSRLTKKQVRFWDKLDEFCLAFEEQERIAAHIAELEVADEDFQAELTRCIVAQAQAMGLDLGDQLNAIAARTRTLLEKILLRQGERFATAVSTGDLSGLELNDLNSDVITDVSRNGDFGLRADATKLLAFVIADFMRSSSPEAHVFLRRLSDGYTLFAFLSATPDVQAAVKKMFSHGDIWLDTTIILPVIAEDLLAPEQRRFTRLLQAAAQVGLRLRVTPGVLEEVERHMNRSLACWRGTSPWQGKTPFLFGVYTASGRPPSGFANWIEQFAGQARPVDDIAAYLSENLALEVASLEDNVERADPDLRAAVQEIWHAAHARRRGVDAIEPDTLARLVRHDVENYVGVIDRRTQEGSSPLGYTSWWMTVDPTAFAVRSVLGDYLRVRVPDSPVMSPDFLTNYLALGPNRRSLDKNSELQLPLMANVGALDLATDIVAVANAVRAEHKDLPERIISRRVRDRLDETRRREGLMAREGIAGAEKRLRASLQELRERNGKTQQQ